MKGGDTMGFADGTIEKYLEHMRKLHGATGGVEEFAQRQIELVLSGVRDIRLGDDAVILLDGLVEKLV